MRIAVYTCLNEDHPDPPVVAVAEPGVDYLCFSTNATGSSSLAEHRGWRQIDLSSADRLEHLPQAVKILPHQFLPSGYDCSVYVEGMDIVGSMRALVEAGLNHHDMALYEHPFRERLCQEVQACLDAGRASWWQLTQQYASYRRAGFQDSSRLHECSLLLRRHQAPELIRFAQSWWYLFLTGAPLDQVAFGFAQWLCPVSFHSLGRSDPRYDKKYFAYRPSLRAGRSSGAGTLPQWGRWGRRIVNRAALPLLRALGRDPLAEERWSQFCKIQSTASPTGLPPAISQKQVARDTDIPA